ncbi:MAG: phosphopentomutase [Alphaproteobacteria bacterium]|nr:phosphopentomutase [Alphaproteobacteria bacterium]
MSGKVIILMMDSFGVGGAPDADRFGDQGANTFAHIVQTMHGLNVPHLQALGLETLAKEAGGVDFDLNIFKKSPLNIGHKFGHACEISKGKDTTSGHWEMAGTPVLTEWGYFHPDYPSFPAELVEKICHQGKVSGILGNKAASGTAILDELGEEHIRTLRPIVYTSADSVLQIACHETYFGLDRLYALCETAFEAVKPYHIARVIARPFVGEQKGQFVRTKNRHDYSVNPPEITILNKASTAGHQVIAVGKIADIYARSGIDQAYKASGLPELWDVTLNAVKNAAAGSLIFTNFVDFDMVYGHRRDVKGYAQGLEYFDSRLPELVALLDDDDIVFITADHGCDPTYRGTDHTREQVPVILFGRRIMTENIGQRTTYADIAQTIAEFYNIKPMKYGKSFL